MDTLKILLIGCLVSFSSGEFRLPEVCDEWLSQCHQFLHQEALFAILLSPSSLTTNGSPSLDCSVEAENARQRCNATIPLVYCSFPLPIEGISQLLSHLCGNLDVITRNADCWSDPDFLQKWNDCTRMSMGGYESIKDCIQEETSSIPTSVCSASAVSVISELPDIFVSAMTSFF